MKKILTSVPLKRRSLLKAGGALIINFNFQTASFGQNQSLAAGPPDPEQIDSWIAIHQDNSATVFIGFAELGQGCSTALLQVAAEELDLSRSQVSTIGLDTHIPPNQGGTSSRKSSSRKKQRKVKTDSKPVVISSGPRETGSVKWFSASKGFGFITRDSGDDIFVHFRSIVGDGHRILREGQRVNFAVTEGDKGLQAEEVDAEK